MGGGVRDSVFKWHNGEGGSLLKCHVTFFPKFLSHLFAFCAIFKGFKGHNFWKNLNFTSHEGGRGGTDQYHKMTKGGGGVKNQSKKCHVLFEWPLIHHKQKLRILQQYEKFQAKRPRQTTTTYFLNFRMSCSHWPDSFSFSRPDRWRSPMPEKLLWPVTLSSFQTMFRRREPWDRCRSSIRWSTSSTSSSQPWT